MTDQELQQEFQLTADELKALIEREKDLTKPEKKRRNFLRLKKLALERIMEARKSNNKSQEFSHVMNYGLITTLGEKHPLLMMFVKSKIGIQL